MTAEPEYSSNGGIHNELHDRHIHDYQLFSHILSKANAVGIFVEAFLFVVLTGESLDHTDTDEVLLDFAVHIIVLSEHFLESWVRF